MKTVARVGPLKTLGTIRIFFLPQSAQWVILSLRLIVPWGSSIIRTFSSNFVLSEKDEKNSHETLCL